MITAPKSDTSKQSVSLEASRSVAVVSGKGGSGKTMIVATFARILDQLSDSSVILVDTDIGTGGLSYYLGINYSQGIGHGVSENLLAMMETNSSLPLLLPGTVRQLNGFSKTKFVSAGDLRKLQAAKTDKLFEEKITNFLSLVRDQEKSILLIDCRGGVDHESLAVCDFVDDIIIIAETDPASFQATQTLANVLADAGAAEKIRGFIVNRVFDDPTVIVRQGVSAFKGQFLGAIPFDIEAIRDFHVGKLPSGTSTFTTHVWHALAQAYPLNVRGPARVWSFSEYGSTNVGDYNSAAGGLVFTMASIGLIAAALVMLAGGGETQIPPTKNFFILADKSYYFLLSGAILAVLGGVGALRRVVGNIFVQYLTGVLRIWERFAK
jgi:septum site-determining protein MinD